MQAAKTTWKQKVFGDNKVNFYGWIFAGIFDIVWAFKYALMGLEQSNIPDLLFAIFIILVGIMALSLQNYHARLSEKLD